MDSKVTFKSSAFKHGVTLEDILHALGNPEYEGPIEGYENKYIVIGFTTIGNLIEIVYYERND